MSSARRYERCVRGFLQQGRSSRGRDSSPQPYLPGFCPAVYPGPPSKPGLPLSDQTPAKQAGTLDAHFDQDPVQGACRRARVRAHPTIFHIKRELMNRGAEARAARASNSRFGRAPARRRCCSVCPNAERRDARASAMPCMRHNRASRSPCASNQPMRHVADGCRCDERGSGAPGMSSPSPDEPQLRRELAAAFRIAARAVSSSAARLAGTAMAQIEAARLACAPMPCTTPPASRASIVRKHDRA